MATDRTGSERPTVTAHQGSSSRRSEEMVVAVDGMQASIAAVEWAAREADALGLRLRLVHVIEWPYTTSAMNLAEALALSTELLAEAAARARSVSRALDVVTDSRRGRLGPTLLELAAQPHTLVLGHRTMRGYASMLLGSVSVAIAAHAAGPVVVVPESTPSWWRPSGALVVVGTDGSRDGDRGVEYAFAYADRHGFGVDVATADASWTNSDSEYAGPEADPVVVATTAAHPHVPWQPRRLCGHPAEALAGAAAVAALLVVGGNRSRGRSSPVLGSVSRGAIFLARCPVAVV